MVAGALTEKVGVINSLPAAGEAQRGAIAAARPQQAAERKESKYYPAAKRDALSTSSCTLCAAAAAQRNHRGAAVTALRGAPSSDCRRTERESRFGTEAQRRPSEHRVYVLCSLFLIKYLQGKPPVLYTVIFQN